MRFFKVRLDRRWECGNYKVMDYYVQANDSAEALRHVRQRHPGWRILSYIVCLAPPEIPA